MHRDLMLVATDIMESVRDGRYKTTVLTRFSTDELSPAMHHVANLLEADARFLRIAYSRGHQARPFLVKTRASLINA